MRDFYYKLEEGKGPTMEDHLNALDLYVKSPIELAFNTLEETVDVGGPDREEINNSFCTIQAALIAWEKIDAQMIADRVKNEAVTA